MKTRALVLPGDEPARPSTVKRLLLFYDRVVLPSPEDQALVNDKEISEKWGNVTFYWSLRSPYPQVDGFTDRSLALLEELSALRRRGLIEIGPARADERLSIAHLRAQSLGLAQATLVRSAIPDYSPDAKARSQIPDSCVLFGGAMAPVGRESRYTFDEAGPMAELPIDQDWVTIARLRLSRTLKYTQIAQHLRAVPVADDDTNLAIQAAFAGVGFDEPLAASEMASLAITTDRDIQNPFEAAVEHLSWDEVAQVRREVLPVLSPLRSELHRLAASLSALGHPSISDYKRALVSVKSQYSQLQDRASEALERLKLGAVFKGLPAAWTAVTGMSIIASPTDPLTLMGKVLSGGLAAGAALYPEIRDCYLARRRAGNHPFFLATASAERIREVAQRVRVSRRSD